MKTKNNKHQSYFRLHHRGVMVTTIAVLLFCLVKFDQRVATVLREAYVGGFGTVGEYAREGEMTRYPINFGATSRVQTISSF